MVTISTAPDKLLADRPEGVNPDSFRSVVTDEFGHREIHAIQTHSSYAFDS